METDPLVYKKAQKKAREIRSFYYNLTCYCIIIPILIFVNLHFTPQFYWFYFSMLGWGMGVLFHGMAAFEWNPFLGKNWEERKLQQILDKERKKEHNRNQY